MFLLSPLLYSPSSRFSCWVFVSHKSAFGACTARLLAHKEKQCARSSVVAHLASKRTMFSGRFMGLICSFACNHSASSVSIFVWFGGFPSQTYRSPRSVPYSTRVNAAGLFSTYATCGVFVCLQVASEDKSRPAGPECKLNRRQTKIKHEGQGAKA